jgi:4-hydroxybenzoyl-CoA thioesterase/acyl-CoA thioester hydrolase
MEFSKNFPWRRAAAAGRLPAMAARDLPRIDHEVTVMFYDTDCAAVVHNLAYLRFIEEARTIMAEKMGMPLRSMVETGLYPVVLRTEIDYRAPGKLGDHLHVRGGVSELGRVRFWVNFEIIRPEDNTLLITCRQSLALIRMPGAKAERLPEEWFRDS